ncbi:MAG TPA: DUF1330 domain-containing protein [Pseudonocardiaceae bacterium]|jgi:uncharacterized protein (DUF1330 family)|nr:DUF1330 domain-containing protein [Pseudonocardiaceae bacterium]
MAKGYWISAYREVHDPEKLAAYGKLAGPAITASGGRFLVRGGQIEAHDAGRPMRTVIVEFDSFAAAVAAHETPAYQDALAVLADGVERDFRIVEGL